jgi:hypothetical protein
LPSFGRSWRNAGWSARFGASSAAPALLSDFNPIERAFAKLKAPLRAGATRTIADLWHVIRNAIAQLTPESKTTSPLHDMNILIGTLSSLDAQQPLLLHFLIRQEATNHPTDRADDAINQQARS